MQAAGSDHSDTDVEHEERTAGLTQVSGAGTGAASATATHQAQCPVLSPHYPPLPPQNEGTK